MIACKNICKSFGIKEILKDVTFLIEPKEKVAIVGVNGAGKTTLFRIITGEQTSDSGEIVMQKSTRLGYMNQLTDSYETKKTIYEEMLDGVKHIINLEEEIRELEQEMSTLQGAELDSVMNKYSRLSHEFEEHGGYGYESRVKGVLRGLGFAEEDFDRSLSSLSGGQKTRLELAKLLSSRPDVILLDEPTNHLDIESVEWLENFLKNYNGTVVIISHDRYFLDRICTKIVEIENTKATVYNGNYTYYTHKKEVDREIQLKHYVNQQKEIKRQEEIIKTLKSYNREKSVKRAESREKNLEKMERLDKPEDLPDTMRIALEPKNRSGNDVLEVDSLAKSFGENQIFKNVSFAIKRGEKVALIGANGVGKTTLFRIILGQEPDAGTVDLGQNVVIGYYDQEQQILDTEKTIIQEIHDAYPKLPTLKIYNVLAAFVFMGDDVHKKIGSLSGGERGRVALAKIMLSNANFLILDEPTNHLDIFSKDILENALKHYEGTILFISHDRYFVNNISDKVLDMTSDGVTTYHGNYEYYSEKKNEGKEEAVQVTSAEPITEAKLTWQQKKEKQSEDQKKRTALKRTESDIEKLEKQIIKLEEDQANPEVYTNAVKSKEVYDKKVEASEALESLYEQWEQLSNYFSREDNDL